MALVVITNLGDALGIEIDRQKTERREQPRDRQAKPPDWINRRGHGKQAQHRRGQNSSTDTDSQGAPFAQTLADPTQHRVLHHIKQAQPEQDRAQHRQRHAKGIGVIFRRVDIDRQTRARQDGGKAGISRITLRQRDHFDTSSLGGAGRER